MNPVATIPRKEVRDALDRIDDLLDRIDAALPHPPARNDTETPGAEDPR